MFLGGGMTILNAADVLKRYREEDLPEFSEIDLISVNQSGIFGNKPIHIACIRGRVDEVNVLINGGADINSPGECGYTPLHEAVEQNFFKVVKLLLQSGANPVIQNDFGDTPLDIARDSSQQNIIDLLVLFNK